MSIPESTQVFGVTPSLETSRETSSKEATVKGFTYPIPTSPGKGFFSNSTGLQLVKNMVKSFLRTNRGERFMLTDYGADLQKYLMEPLDETTFRLIKDEIDGSIRKYLGALLAASKLQVFETRSGNILVKLFLELKDSESSSFNVEVRI